MKSAPVVLVVQGAGVLEVQPLPRLGHRQLAEPLTQVVVVVVGALGEITPEQEVPA